MVGSTQIALIYSADLIVERNSRVNMCNNAGLNLEACWYGLELVQSCCAPSLSSYLGWVFPEKHTSAGW